MTFSETEVFCLVVVLLLETWFLWMRALSSNKLPVKPRLARLLSAGVTGSATTPSLELLFSVDLELSSPYVAMLPSLP